MNNENIVKHLMQLKIVGHDKGLNIFTKSKHYRRYCGELTCHMIFSFNCVHVVPNYFDCASAVGLDGCIFRQEYYFLIMLIVSSVRHQRIFCYCNENRSLLSMNWRAVSHLLTHVNFAPLTQFHTFMC